jgi:RimJ/RimL family protein N-acetyltransferase
MIKVPIDQYSIIKKEIREAPTFAHSILDFMIEGTVYSDCTNYHSLLFQTASGLFFVTGCPSNELFMEHLIDIFEKTVLKGNRFTLFSNGIVWEQAIEKFLNKRVRRIDRIAYSFDLKTYSNRTTIASPYDVYRINSCLIENSLEFNERYYEEYWDSKENFLQNGIGFCVKDKNRIIGEAVSIFKSNNYAEIDIITDPAYRGKGVAILVSQRFIDYCLSINIQPRWDCDVDNRASVNLANKFGFINPKKYAIYIKA